jgi:vitamin B12 transporter
MFFFTRRLRKRRPFGVTIMFRSLILSSTALFIATSAYATEKEIPHIVITATRTPTPITQIASSVTVIDAAEIERKHKPTVIQLLQEIPGVTLANSGGVGQNTRVFLRGTNSNHVLVMMDGVVVNDPSDPATAFDFSNLTTDNIERIEILRGPQSTLYGSQALGGVINIISKKGSGAPKYTGFAEYGRYNSSKVGIGTNGEIGKTSYSFSAGKSHTDGISALDKKFGGKEKDGNDTYSFAGNIESKLTDIFKAKLNGRYNRSITDFDSVGSIGGGGARPNDDTYPNGDNRQINLRGAGELTLLDGKWVQELGISTLNFNRALITEYFDSSFTAFFGRQQYTGRRDTLDWVHHLKLINNHATTVGFEIYSDHFKAPASSEVNVDNRAAFIDDQYSVTPNLYVNYGARFDDHQSFGRQFTWKVAPGYNITSTNTRLKASYGTGFKAPSLSQLFDPTSGNSDLAPERSKGWDAGFEQSLFADKVTFGSTVFRNYITNLVGFGPSPLFLTLNVGKARTEGFENSFSYRPTDEWNIRAGHTYTLTANRRNSTELLRRPKHQFNLGSDYQYSDAGDVGMNIRYAGSRRDYDWNTSALSTLPSFTVLDLTTNYKINANTSVYARLDNVLDKRYEEVSGFGQVGRSLYVGVKATY